MVKLDIMLDIAHGASENVVDEIFNDLNSDTVNFIENNRKAIINSVRDKIIEFKPLLKKSAMDIYELGRHTAFSYVQSHQEEIIDYCRNYAERILQRNA